MNDTNITCNKCGQQMVEKNGQYGTFLACTGYPECKNTKQLHPHDQASAPNQIEIPEADKKCEKCGSLMAVKHGRYGPFLACTGYPNCRNIKNIDIKTGVGCPECGQGDIVEKRSRQGKIFYSCNKYPNCKFALWSKPTGDKCHDCNSLLVAGPGGSARCSNKTCKVGKT